MRRSCSCGERSRLIAWRNGSSLNGGCLVGLVLPVLGLAIVLLIAPREELFKLTRYGVS